MSHSRIDLNTKALNIFFTTNILVLSVCNCPGNHNLKSFPAKPKRRHSTNSEQQAGPVSHSLGADSEILAGNLCCSTNRGNFISDPLCQWNVVFLIITFYSLSLRFCFNFPQLGDLGGHGSSREFLFMFFSDIQWSMILYLECPMDGS